MSFLWLSGTLYCIYILFSAFRQTSDRHKKDTIKFLLLGFVCIAVLSLTNTPAIYGHEIYPLGTFTFIPLLLLAYGLFKYNLRIALQQLRAILFTAGHLILVAGAAFVPAIFFPGAAHQFKLGVGIVLVAFLYHPLYKLWDHALGLFFKRPSDLLQKELYALTVKLSEVRHLQSIHHEISKWFFRIFANSRCATIFADAHHRVYKGWRSVNADPYSGFFHSPPENINQLMIEKMQTAEETQTAPGKLWTLRQMKVRENRVIGKIIVKGSMSNPFTGKVIAIFLAQVSAAAYNKLLMNKLETSANTDSLTGVPNRAFFDWELKKIIKNARLFPMVSFSVIMIDINGLKRVNDKFGHDKGDEMIRAVAELLLSVCRETDTLSRMGGDEFIILLPSTTSAEANVTAARIRAREKSLSLVCRLESPGQVSIPIRFSMGVAGSDETFPEKVMKLADHRMYIDKENFYQKTVESMHVDHS